MSNSMSWKWVQVDGQQRIQLEGTISEHADFRSIVDAAPDTLVLDLAHVEQINSCGVREWINFVTDLKRSGKTLELHRCSPAIVRQLNMISNFRGGGKVQSVLAPYFCDACENEITQLVEVGNTDARPEIAETLPCPNCGEDMEFDDLADSYLGFLWQ